MSQSRNPLKPSTESDPRRERVGLLLTLVAFGVIAAMLVALFVVGLTSGNVYLLLAVPPMMFTLCKVTIWPVLDYRASPEEGTK